MAVLGPIFWPDKRKGSASCDALPFDDGYPLQKTRPPYESISQSNGTIWRL